jgi:phosphatidate phosphatase APP1
VSASPWQLYIPLAEFLGKAGFPAGTFHMKDFRVKDRTFLALFADPQAYKLRVITPILERFPERKFILVGDSGEKDPEIYGILARRFPRQIVAVLIRNVTGSETNWHTFVPPELRVVFNHPNELPDIYLRLTTSP